MNNLNVAVLHCMETSETLHIHALKQSYIITNIPVVVDMAC